MEESPLFVAVTSVRTMTNVTNMMPPSIHGTSQEHWLRVVDNFLGMGAQKVGVWSWPGGGMMMRITYQVSKQQTTGKCLGPCLTCQEGIIISAWSLWMMTEFLNVGEILHLLRHSFSQRRQMCGVGKCKCMHLIESKALSMLE